MQCFGDILESQETTHAKSGNTNLMRCIGWSGRRVLCVLAFPAMHFSWLFHFHLMSTFQGNLQPNERPVRHQQHDEQWHSDVLAQKRFDNLPAPWPWTLWFPRMILTRYCNSHPSLNYHLHSFIYTCFYFLYIYLIFPRCTHYSQLLLGLVPSVQLYTLLVFGVCMTGKG